MPTDKLLRIFLNDHLAVATATRELAKRAARKNGGSALGVFLGRLRGDVEADQAALEAVMRRLGFSQAPLKRGAVWAAEKIGRLKLNGRLTGYSPLSRVLELQGLMVAVELKGSLWRCLKRIAEDDGRLRDTDFDALVARADSQRTELEGHLLDAAAGAFRT